MLLLELLSRLQNSKTLLLFWNLFTDLKFLNALNINHLSYLQNSQYHSAIVSLWPRIYSASSRSQHTLFTLCHSDQTIIITQTLIDPSDMRRLIFGISFLHHSEFIIRITPPLSATFIWTCRFNLLNTATTFHRFITFSLFHSELKTYLFRNLIIHLSLFLSVGLIS